MTSLIAPNWQENYIAALRNGDLPATAAATVGATQKQVDFWRTQSEEFDDQCAQVLAERVDMLEKKAFDLAIDGSLKTIYHQGIPVGEEQVEHKDLLMFMLKASRDKFNDKLITQSKVDHNINISINSFTTDPINPREVIEGEFTTQQPNAITSNPGDIAHRADIRQPIEAYT